MCKDVLSETKDPIIEEMLLEMAKIDKLDYSLPVEIWVDEAGSNRKTKHNDKRVKIANNYDGNVQDTLSISIENNPKILAGVNKLKTKDLNKVLKFISKNYQILDDRWENKITTRQMFAELDNNN